MTSDPQRAALPSDLEPKITVEAVTSYEVHCDCGRTWVVKTPDAAEVKAEQHREWHRRRRDV